jgi:dCTP diphosphatase
MQPDASKPQNSLNMPNDLNEIRRMIRRFRDDRDWMQFHNPKNLACSISIEAAELLEHFQWKTPEESEVIIKTKRTEISHEIADVAIYLIELADNLSIDLVQAIKEKIALNAAKYPAKKARGSAAKYSEL